MNIEEQAKVWSNMKYNEKREEDLRKWRIGEYAGSSINKREPEIMEGAKSKKRRKYKIVEEDWGLGEQLQQQITVQEEEPVETEGSPCTKKHKELQTAAVLEELRATEGAKKQTKLSDFWPAPVLKTAPPTVTGKEDSVLDIPPVPEPAMRAAPSTDLPIEEVDERTVRDELYTIDERSCLEENVKPFDSSTTPVLGVGGAAVMNDNNVGRNVTMMDECVNTQVNDEHSHSVVNPAPSVGYQKNSRIESSSDVVCKPDKLGLCRTHECGGSITKVSSKKWKDRGGGRGYGYVHSTTKKFLCDSRKSAYRKTKVDASERLRDYEPADRQVDVSTGLVGTPGHVAKKF